MTCSVAANSPTRVRQSRQALLVKLPHFPKRAVVATSFGRLESCPFGKGALPVGRVTFPQERVLPPGSQGEAGGSAGSWAWR